MIDLTDVTTLTPEMLAHDLLREQREVLRLFYESQQQRAQSTEENEKSLANGMAEIERTTAQQRSDINKLVDFIKSAFNKSQNRLLEVHLGNLLIASQSAPKVEYPSPEKVLAIRATQANKFFEEIWASVEELLNLRRLRKILLTVSGFIALAIVVAIFAGIIYLAQQIGLSTHYKAAEGAIQSRQWEIAYHELSAIQKVDKDYKDVTQLMNRVLPGYLQILSQSGRCDEIMADDIHGSSSEYYTQCGVRKALDDMVNGRWDDAWSTVQGLNQDAPIVIQMKLAVIARGGAPQSNDTWKYLNIHVPEQYMGQGTPNTHLWLDDIEPLTDGTIFLDLAITIDDGYSSARIVQPDRVYLEIAGTEVSLSKAGGIFGNEMYIPELNISGGRQTGHIQFAKAVQMLPQSGCFTFHYGSIYTIENICIWTRSN